MSSESGNRPKTPPKRDFIMEVTPEMSKEEVLSNLIKHLEKQGIKVKMPSPRESDFNKEETEEESVLAEQRRRLRVTKLYEQARKKPKEDKNS